MAVKRIKSDVDVISAARQRVKNVFSNGVTVYMSFSGGKDSLSLAKIVYDLIEEHEIDPTLLTVVFIDEEAIFDCIERTVIDWRKKFLLVGARFQWWCIEVKHFNCFNELTSDESFICWDSEKSDVWVRQPPPYAIRSHPRLNARHESYQEFLPKVTMDGITISGVRAAESVQRLQYMSALGTGMKGMTGKNTIYPIYDWKTADVWLYLLREQVDIPEVYLQMWQSGVGKNGLRVSQFFSIDTVPNLIHLGEYDPTLMERIIKREPNAYLAVLYWDSEMFRRNSKTRQELERRDRRNYRDQLKGLLFGSGKFRFTSARQRKVADQYRKMYIKMDGKATQKHYRKACDALVAGDPKLRTLRAIYQDIATDYVIDAKRQRNGGAANV
jgi:predicted phosphoadenosine phosphosulfate sulfurtransferase